MVFLDIQFTVDGFPVSVFWRRILLLPGFVGFLRRQRLAEFTKNHVSVCLLLRLSRFSGFRLLACAFVAQFIILTVLGFLDPCFSASLEDFESFIVCILSASPFAVTHVMWTWVPLIVYHQVLKFVHFSQCFKNISLRLDIFSFPQICC